MDVSQEKCLILGAAVGYQAKQIAPFIASLRNTAYHGDVALLVDAQLARRLEILSLFDGVTTIVVPQWLPMKHGLLKRKWAMRLFWHPMQWLMQALLRILSWLPLAEKSQRSLKIALGAVLFPPTEARYLHAYRFLQSHDYDRVLLCDVRDVLFQEDPFKHLPQVGLAASIEHRRYTVGSEPYNSYWVRQAYGEDMLRRIADKPVACSGVTYGDAAAIQRYLRMIGDEIFALNAPSARQPGTDQGIHNVLLWTGRYGEFHRLETFDSAIATLGGAEPKELNLDRGHLFNRDGSVVSVLHQYDRIPGYAECALRELAPQTIDSGH